MKALVYLKSILILLGCLLESLVGLLMAVWWANVIFSHIHVNTPLVETTEADFTCYLTTNRVHTDFVISKKDLDAKLQSELKQLYQLSDTSLSHLAFGWGEGGFFMKTKKWEDLTVGTLLVSTFHLGNPAMHVVAEKEPIVKKGKAIRLKLNKHQFQLLMNYINSTFDKKGGRFIAIRPHTYGENHLFFEANQSYGLFNTCNTWTNNVLKHAELPAVVWTLFPEEIMKSYE